MFSARPDGPSGSVAKTPTDLPGITEKRSSDEHTATARPEDWLLSGSGHAAGHRRHASRVDHLLAGQLTAHDREDDGDLPCARHPRTAHGDEELAGGSYWGIVSDADLLRAAESGDIDEQKARTLAAQPVVTIASSEALSHAAQLMVDRDVSHLIVIESRSARPIGVLSTLDVARALAGFPEQHPAFR